MCCGQAGGVCAGLLQCEWCACAILVLLVPFLGFLFVLCTDAQHRAYILFVLCHKRAVKMMHATFVLLSMHAFFKLPGDDPQQAVKNSSVLISTSAYPS